jgi:hypothetical protein
MPLTDAGRHHIAQALIGEAVDAFKNSNARPGAAGGFAQGGAMAAWPEPFVPLPVSPCTPSQTGAQPQRGRVS